MAVDDLFGVVHTAVTYFDGVAVKYFSEAVNIYIYIKLFGNTKLCFHFQIEHSIKKEKSCLAIEYSH